MRVLRRVLTVGLLVSVVAWAGTEEERAVAEGAEALSAEELEALYLGNTVAGITPGGYRFETYVAADGSIPATERRGSGEFTVPEDGKACMRFDDVWEGQLRCWTYYRIENGIRMYNEEGAPAADIEPGG